MKLIPRAESPIFLSNRQPKSLGSCGSHSSRNLRTVGLMRHKIDMHTPYVSHPSHFFAFPASPRIVALLGMAFYSWRSNSSGFQKHTAHSTHRSTARGCPAIGSIDEKITSFLHLPSLYHISLLSVLFFLSPSYTYMSAYNGLFFLPLGSRHVASGPCQGNLHLEHIDTPVLLHFDGDSLLRCDLDIFLYAR